MESVVWVSVHFVIHNATCFIRGTNGWSNEAIGASHYFPLDMLFALPIVNQNTLLSQRREIHGNKVNLQTPSTNGKWKKEPKYLWLSLRGLFIYLFMAKCLW